MKLSSSCIMFILCALIFGKPTTVRAVSVESEAAAQLAVHEVVSVVDTRIVHLEAYLKSHNSPLAAHASDFITEADNNRLDWRLVVAIAGTESTFGKHVPSGSYNAWGWGIPTGARSGIGFGDWKHGIATVSEGLRKKYADKGADTIEKMGRIYAASPRWAGNVRYFINKIDAYTPIDSDYLDVTI